MSSVHDLVHAAVRSPYDSINEELYFNQTAINQRRDNMNPYEITHTRITNESITGTDKYRH